MRYQPRTKPYPHQAKATLRAVRHGNLAFFMDPGTGKTKAAIDAIAIQHLRRKCDRFTVVCPLSAIPVWEDEIEKHMPNRAYGSVDWQLINYDKVSRRHRKGARWAYPYIASIEEFQPDIIVLDESHRCKSASSNRARALWRLVERLRQSRDDDQPFVYLLTGTPNPKGYIDLFAQFRIMDSSVFGTSKSQFEDLYCVFGFGRNQYRIIRYRDTKSIKEKIHAHAIVVPKHKATALPEQTWQNVRVQLPPQARRTYNQMANDLIADLENQTLEATNAGTRRLRLIQITGGFTTDGTPIHDAKLRTIADMAKDLADQGEALVIYCRFLSEVSAVADIIDHSYPSRKIFTGSTKTADRRRYLKEFEAGKVRCIVFQVDTGSLAISLTRSREVIFYSLPDAWDTYYQACNRIHRIGQDRNVRYRHIICPNTVDMSQLRLLRGKADMHAELMGNMRQYLFGG